MTDLWSTYVKFMIKLLPLIYYYLIRETKRMFSSFTLDIVFAFMIFKYEINSHTFLTQSHIIKEKSAISK